MTDPSSSEDFEDDAPRRAADDSHEDVIPMQDVNYVLRHMSPWERYGPEIKEWLVSHRRSCQEAVGSVGRHALDRVFPSRRDFSSLSLHVERDGLPSFVAPQPWQLATGSLDSRWDACRVGFGVSPIWDQIYVRDLEVVPELRRRGLAVALLTRVVHRCRVEGRCLPVTPIQETIDSFGFWERLRCKPFPDLYILESIRLCDLDREAAQWHDLAQSSAEMSRFVRQRLGSREPPTQDVLGTPEHRRFLRWLDKSMSDRARDP